MEAHGPLITGIVLLAAGVLLLGWGYRLIRQVLVVAGLLMGAALGWEICKAIGVTGGLTWVGIAVGALLLAALMPMVRRAGVFLLGCGAGWGMAVILLGPPQALMEYLVPAAAALVGGVAVLLLEKMLLIVATSYLGAVCVTLGFGTLTRVGITAGQFMSADHPPDIPIAVVIAVFGLCVLGVGAQLGYNKGRREKAR